MARKRKDGKREEGTKNDLSMGKGESKRNGNSHYILFY
jgi:hypothetical protein